jgi:hypothetical protein
VCRGIVLLLVVLPAALPALAEDAASIIARMQQATIDRAEGVNAYRMTRRVMGQASTQYYQRVDVETQDGGFYPVFQPVSVQDLRCSVDAETQRMSAEDLEAYAGALETTGDAMATEVENGLEEAGLPRGLFTAMGAGGDPWATTDLRRMTGSMAVFARGAAEAERDNQAEAAAADPGADRRQMLEFGERAKLVGTESLDGTDAYHLRADGLDYVQEADGQTFTIEVMSVWIDVAHLVPLKTVMEGTVSSSEGDRPMVIEKLDQDYRNVPDSRLYESHRQVMRIEGMMDETQTAQAAEVQKQMAELKKQLAAMPPDQRKMMESMMGSQLGMMPGMAQGGGMDIETTVDEIRVLPAAAGECVESSG